MQKFFISLLLFQIAFTGFSQTSQEQGLRAIQENVVESQLEFLSSDWTEGRGTGTRGAYMAADYIASMFKFYGLEPGGDPVSITYSRREKNQGKRDKSYRSYFQNFQLIEYSTGDQQELSVLYNDKEGCSSLDFEYKSDFSVSPGHISQSGKAGVVFVGYGLKDDKKNYNDYKGLDVEGKIILRLKGYPGCMKENSAGWKKFKPADRWGEYRMNKAKGIAAAEAGALAVLEVNLNSTDYKDWADNIPFRYNTPLYEGDKRLESYYDTRMVLPGDNMEPDPPVFTVSKRIALGLLSASGLNVERWIEEVAESLEPGSKVLGKTQVSFRTQVNSRLINARNVIGVLKGKDTTEMIVVGGHYDHLGKHGGYIWNGADDNASGTVGVMTIAKACLETGVKPEKTIVFAAWTGEEKGLWGSTWFASHPWNNQEVIFNLNYDMISRDNKDDKKGNICSMMFTDIVPELETWTKEHTRDYNIDLDIRYRAMGSARGGSDHAPFAEKGIPYFYFMAGFPPEYHQPDDHIELVNIPKMTNIIRLGFLNIWKIANMEDE